MRNKGWSLGNEGMEIGKQGLALKVQGNGNWKTREGAFKVEGYGD